METWRKKWRSAYLADLVDVRDVSNEPAHLGPDEGAVWLPARVVGRYRLRADLPWAEADGCSFSYRDGDDPLETIEADAVRRSCLAELKSLAKFRALAPKPLEVGRGDHQDRPTRGCHREPDGPPAGLRP